MSAMPYRPYPNVDRALRQLARKERVTCSRYVTSAGLLAEDYDFPGQSFAVFAARLPAPREGLYVMSTRTEGHDR